MGLATKAQGYLHFRQVEELQTLMRDELQPPSQLLLRQEEMSCPVRVLLNHLFPVALILTTQVFRRLLTSSFLVDQTF